MRRVFKPDVPASMIRQTVIAYRVGWSTYTLAALTALAAPVLSFALFLLIAGYYLFPRGVDTDRPSSP